jgi:hypothetical protein
MMMMGFVGDEMALKTKFLICDLMVISNALVLCIISLKERF